MNAARLLLVCLSNIGDAVMTTPVMESLHERFPGATIDVVTDRRSAAVFKYCPYRGRLFYKHKRLALRGLIPLMRELRTTAYEVIVDLRTDFLPWLLRGRRRFCKWSGKAYGPHAVERHMGAIADLHGDAPLPATRVWVGRAEAEFANTALAGLNGASILALGPGANWPPKIWPAASFAGLMAEFTTTFDAAVLLGDQRDAIHARSLTGGPLPCRDLCGRTSLLEAAAVLQQSTVFVGNDSGLGHLASAAGTPTLTLFGPGDAVRYRPWGSRAAWLAAPRGDLPELSPARVADKLREHLEAVRAADPFPGSAAS